MQKPGPRGRAAARVSKTDVAGRKLNETKGLEMRLRARVFVSFL